MIESIAVGRELKAAGLPDVLGAVIAGDWVSAAGGPMRWTSRTPQPETSSRTSCRARRTRSTPRSWTHIVRRPRGLVVIPSSEVAF